ncbi:sulfite exporter TauE/SafE family protein [Campylobacter sp. 19-13652]|uniref:sulfite exporter TauE/SafE family protein n=1 Tax=Campylobacter sp. 19-13652 TaxID=2840180 RepID=UPI001C7531DA|nr:sulfite exporter TauE/SafE family protein [Campylobacter sp. 19-13652]BCX80099.1 membrane protein [Campylobacter sp. 19-13652]
MPKIAFIVSVAVLNSLSHCMAMCGGFNTLLGVSLRQRAKGAKAIGYFLFHFGRILSYVLLGILTASFGASVVISQKARALLFFAVGCFMVFVAAALYFRGSILAILESKRLAGVVSSASTSIVKSLNNPKNFFIKILALGVLNGLLPCGVVYYFLSYAMLSQSWQEGALIMAIFGICTLPALIFAGAFASFLARFRGVFLNFTLLLVGLNGIYLAYLGYLAYG